MMSFKEFKATVCKSKVAGPQKDIKMNNTTTSISANADSAKDHNTVLPSTSCKASSPSPSPSISSTPMQEDLHTKLGQVFTFVDDTYRDLRRFSSGLYKNSYSTQLIRTINKYKNGCNENISAVLNSYDMSLRLSQNIVRTVDIFKELCTCLADFEEYQYRMCEIVSVFIVCELRLSVDATQQEQILIAHRIIYIMRRYLVQEEEDHTLYNILRTLVSIPKLFNARDIMCAVFSEFIPIKPVPEVNVLPDKLYILYIIVFFRWMMMQNNDDDKLLIVNFAESFMKPSVSLCSNNLYGAYLPIYTMHSKATRTILNNLKYYRDIRNASIIDNAFKKIVSVVNLCDDNEDEDIIVVDSSLTNNFAELFAAARLEPLTGSFSSIKLEEKTIVGTVDLTDDDESLNTQNSIIERHDKWLNNFQQLAQQYQKSQLMLENTQHNQQISSNEKAAVISLDSDSEGEEQLEKDNSAAVNKEAATTDTTKTSITQNNNCDDLFTDSYPLTTTTINCDGDLESLEVDDGDDVTKISSRFLSATLRTYQAKRSIDNNPPATENRINFVVDVNKLDRAYRRDSIHLSSTPPERHENDDDEDTDVQDEHDDQLDEEASAYTFLPTTSKKLEKEIFAKQIRPMGPYPTYNNINDNSSNSDKVVFSHSLSQNTQQHYKTYYSDSSDAKSPQKQKKRVQFNTSPLGPTASKLSPKVPLKSVLQQQKYKVSETPEYFCCAPSLASSTSTFASNATSSSMKQQEHLAAAATLFRNIFDRHRLPYANSGPFSPTLSSVSSHSLPSTTTKKSRLPKSKKPLKQRRETMGTRDDFNLNSEPERINENRVSIIRNRESLNDNHSTGPLGTSGYVETSDDCYGVTSDSDILQNERYKNDYKLHKRCAVVITPTRELLQYERKRDAMYNEILQKQRRKLELRALEKQREKERRRLGRREEKKDLSERDRNKTTHSTARNYNEIFLSSESEIETNFHVRTLRQRRQSVKDMMPLNIQIEMTEATTHSLLNQIDAHLDKPETKKTKDKTVKQNTDKEKEERNNDDNNADDVNQQTCDISSEKSRTKLRELNLLADIGPHLSPYQLDLPENNIFNEPSPPKTPTPVATTEITQNVSHQATIALKEKVTVTEHVIIQSLDNLLGKTKTQLDTNQQQPATSPLYAHEPKLNVAAIFSSSPSAIPLQTQNTATNENTDNIKMVDNLEQILEVSYGSRSVTSPYNAMNKPPETQYTETSIPLLISNVESLNNFEHLVERQKSDNKERHLIAKETLKANSENLVLQNSTENNKDVMENPAKSSNRHETEISILCSSILNPIEPTISANGIISNISNRTEVSQALQVPNFMSADLSDISFESEISKDLPEIAEPSPVVTDMSDNSSESQVSKTNFNLQNSNSVSHAAEVSDVVLPPPVLPLEMPNIPQHSQVHHEAVQINFSNLNSTLNTPTKFATFQRNDVEGASSNQSLNDLNTPLKFGLQPELDSEKEPEADNNVTKFLDLILNKTVTDAESEARDKIIKELNALTADTIGESSETTEIDNAKIPTAKDTESNENIIGETLKLMEAVSEEKTQNLEEKKENVLQKIVILENSKDKSKSNNACETEYNNFDSNNKNEDITQSTKSDGANDVLNPPKEILIEQKSPSDLKNNLTDAEYTELKSPATKKTFKIKCRVRLKRVNIQEHHKTHKKDTWMAIPITSDETLKNNESNSLMTNCDTVMDTTSLIIKPCLKNNIKRLSDEIEFKKPEGEFSENPIHLKVETKKAKLENKPTMELQNSPTVKTSSQQQLQMQTPTAAESAATAPKSKSKQLKTVTFDLSNLNGELRETTSFNHKSKSKNHAASIAAGAMGCYLKNSRSSRKLPDNTLRAAETLQLFVNTINESTRTTPPAEFNKKRSHIKNKCIAEDETPRPPPASTLMGTPFCKKSCTEKVRLHITSSKCKDQLVSSLATPSISSITSDITTARIYTSSPLDQTLPEYDDNVDTVADTELILPNTTGSLRRKLKRPKKTLTRPEPVDGISNQTECNADDDTDIVADNEDDVFAEELLPIPATNEHILEEIVSARPSHIGTGSAIRDDYMNIEATATVPVYLFNEESRDLATPEPMLSSDTTNLVDSSSYLNNLTSTSHTGLQTNTASTTTSTSSASALSNLEKSMLSPSEHEVSSTQETFYQTTSKSIQTGKKIADISVTNKEKSSGGGGSSSRGNTKKQKNEENSLQKKVDNQTSFTIDLLQNNQVDTTNHSPDICTLSLTPPTPPTTTITNTNINSNRKIRKASTHDEILFNDLQLQQQQHATNKRKNLTTATFCAESTCDNKSKSKLLTTSLEDIKTNGSIAIENNYKQILKYACKRDKNKTNTIELEKETMFVVSGEGAGANGGSSPSTTTTINEEKISWSKPKKPKSSKSSKSKNCSERSTKIVLKASKLAAHIPATNITTAAPVNPLIITIPKSKILRPLPTPTPPTPTDSIENLDQQNEFLYIQNANLFIEKKKETNDTMLQHNNNYQHHHQSQGTGYSITKKKCHESTVFETVKSKPSNSPNNKISPITNIKFSVIFDSESQNVPQNTNSTTATTITPKDKSSSTLKTKTKIKTNSSSNTVSNNNTTTTSTNSKSNSNNNLIFVRDKYDLIKSKEKYNRPHHHDTLDDKNKLKDKTSSSQSKTITFSTSARSNKSSSKEKIKEKHSTSKKSLTKVENELKINLTQNNNKELNLNSTLSSTTNNTRQRKVKNISNSSSTFSAFLSASSAETAALLKTKTNLTTQSETAAVSSVATYQNNTTSSVTSALSLPSVSISTNHVRKKLKTK